MKRWTCAIAIEAEHPAFAGHFPGLPLLPGVSLLAHALEQACLEPEVAPHFVHGSTLVVAKFLAPVGPNCELRFEFEADERGLRVDAYAEDKAVAKAHWRWERA